MPNLRDEKALNYISTNIAANIFGLGYAATPSGLKAVKRMQELNDGDKSEATDEMVTFLVLNTAGVTLIPTSVWL
jgi:spore maturation protein A